MDEHSSDSLNNSKQETGNYNLQVQENCFSNYLIEDSNANPFETLNNYLSPSIADNKKRKTDSGNLNRPKKQKTAARNCTRCDCGTNTSEEELNSIIPKAEQLIQAEEQQRLAHIVKNIDGQDEPKAAVPLITKDKREWVQGLMTNLLADRIDYKKELQPTNSVEAVEQKRPSIVNSNFDDGKTIIERVDFHKDENGNATNKIANSNYPAATSIPSHGINQSRKNEDDFDIMSQNCQENSQFTCLGCCSICFQSLASTPVSSTKCGHIFCTSCIKAAVKSYHKCPICRKRLTLKQIHPLFI